MNEDTDKVITGADHGKLTTLSASASASTALHCPGSPDLLSSPTLRHSSSSRSTNLLSSPVLMKSSTPGSTDLVSSPPLIQSSTTGSMDLFSSPSLMQSSILGSTDLLSSSLLIQSLTPGPSGVGGDLLNPDVPGAAAAVVLSPGPVIRVGINELLKKPPASVKPSPCKKSLSLALDDCSASMENAEEALTDSTNNVCTTTDNPIANFPSSKVCGQPLTTLLHSFNKCTPQEVAPSSASNPVSFPISSRNKLSVSATICNVNTVNDRGGVGVADHDASTQDALLLLSLSTSLYEDDPETASVEDADKQNTLDCDESAVASIVSTAPAASAEGHKDSVALAAQGQHGGIVTAHVTSALTSSNEASHAAVSHDLPISRKDNLHASVTGAPFHVVLAGAQDVCNAGGDGNVSISAPILHVTGHETPISARHDSSHIDIAVSSFNAVVPIAVEPIDIGEQVDSDAVAALASQSKISDSTPINYLNKKCEDALKNVQSKQHDDTATNGHSKQLDDATTNDHSKHSDEVLESNAIKSIDSHLASAENKPCHGPLSVDENKHTNVAPPSDLGSKKLANWDQGKVADQSNYLSMMDNDDTFYDDVTVTEQDEKMLLGESTPKKICKHELSSNTDDANYISDILCISKISDVETSIQSENRYMGHVLGVESSPPDLKCSQANSSEAAGPQSSILTGLSVNLLHKTITASDQSLISEESITPSLSADSKESVTPQGSDIGLVNMTSQIYQQNNQASDAVSVGRKSIYIEGNDTVDNSDTLNKQEALEEINLLTCDLNVKTLENKSSHESGDNNFYDIGKTICTKEKQTKRPFCIGTGIDTKTAPSQSSNLLTTVGQGKSVTSTLCSSLDNYLVDSAKLDKFPAVKAKVVESVIPLTIEIKKPSKLHVEKFKKGLVKKLLKLESKYADEAVISEPSVTGTEANIAKSAMPDEGFESCQTTSALILNNIKVENDNYNKTLSEMDLPAEPQCTDMACNDSSSGTDSKQSADVGVSSKQDVIGAFHLKKLDEPHAKVRNVSVLSETSRGSRIHSCESLASVNSHLLQLPFIIQNDTTVPNQSKVHAEIVFEPESFSHKSTAPHNDRSIYMKLPTLSIESQTSVMPQSPSLTSATSSDPNSCDPKSLLNSETADECFPDPKTPIKFVTSVETSFPEPNIPHLKSASGGTIFLEPKVIPTKPATSNSSFPEPNIPHLKSASSGGTIFPEPKVLPTKPATSDSSFPEPKTLMKSATSDDLNFLDPKTSHVKSATSDDASFPEPKTPLKSATSDDASFPEPKTPLKSATSADASFPEPKTLPMKLATSDDACFPEPKTFPMKSVTSNDTSLHEPKPPMMSTTADDASFHEPKVPPKKSATSDDASFPEPKIHPMKSATSDDANLYEPKTPHMKSATYDDASFPKPKSPPMKSATSDYASFHEPKTLLVKFAASDDVSFSEPKTPPMKSATTDDASFHGKSATLDDLSFPEMKTPSEKNIIVFKTLTSTSALAKNDVTTICSKISSTLYAPRTDRGHAISGKVSTQTSDSEDDLLTIDENVIHSDTAEIDEDFLNNLSIKTNASFLPGLISPVIKSSQKKKELPLSVTTLMPSEKSKVSAEVKTSTDSGKDSLDNKSTSDAKSDDRNKNKSSTSKKVDCRTNQDKTDPLENLKRAFTAGLTAPSKPVSLDPLSKCGLVKRNGPPSNESLPVSNKSRENVARHSLDEKFASVKESVKRDSESKKKSSSTDKKGLKFIRPKKNCSQSGSEKQSSENVSTNKYLQADKSTLSSSKEKLGTSSSSRALDRDKKDAPMSRHAEHQADKSKRSYSSDKSKETDRRKVKLNSSDVNDKSSRDGSRKHDEKETQHAKKDKPSVSIKSASKQTTTDKLSSRKVRTPSGNEPNNVLLEDWMKVGSKTTEKNRVVSNAMKDKESVVMEAVKPKGLLVVKPTVNSEADLINKNNSKKEEQGCINEGLSSKKKCREKIIVSRKSQGDKSPKSVPVVLDENASKNQKSDKTTETLKLFDAAAKRVLGSERELDKFSDKGVQNRESDKVCRKTVENIAPVVSKPKPVPGIIQSIEPKPSRKRNCFPALDDDTSKTEKCDTTAEALQFLDAASKRGIESQRVLEKFPAKRGQNLESTKVCTKTVENFAPIMSRPQTLSGVNKSLEPKPSRKKYCAHALEISQPSKKQKTSPDFLNALPSSKQTVILDIPSSQETTTQSVSPEPSKKEPKKTPLIFSDPCSDLVITSVIGSVNLNDCSNAGTSRRPSSGIPTSSAGNFNQPGELSAAQASASCSNSSKRNEVEELTCSWCRDVWNHYILHSLFRSACAVTVKSRITFGAIYLMYHWATNEKLPDKHEAIYNLLDRADLSKNLQGKNISMLVDWITLRLKSKEQQCCDIFSLVYLTDSSISEKLKGFSAPTSRQRKATVVKADIAKSTPVTQSSPAAGPAPNAKLPSTAATIAVHADHRAVVANVATVEKERSAQSSEIDCSDVVIVGRKRCQIDDLSGTRKRVKHVPGEKCVDTLNTNVNATVTGSEVSCSTLKQNVLTGQLQQQQKRLVPILMGCRSANSRILCGSPCAANVKKEVFAEYNSMSVDVKEVFCNMPFERHSLEYNPDLKRPVRFTTIREVIALHNLCVFPTHVDNADEARLLYRSTVQLLAARGVVLLLPDGPSLVKLTERLRKHYHRSQHVIETDIFLKSCWINDVAFTRMKDWKKIPQNEISLSDVLALFCLWKNWDHLPLMQNNFSHVPQCTSSDSHASYVTKSKPTSKNADLGQEPGMKTTSHNTTPSKTESSTQCGQSTLRKPSDDPCTVSEATNISEQPSQSYSLQTSSPPNADFYKKSLLTSSSKSTNSSPSVEAMTQASTTSSVAHPKPRPPLREFLLEQNVDVAHHPAILKVCLRLYDKFTYYAYVTNDFAKARQMLSRPWLAQVRLQQIQALLIKSSANKENASVEVSAQTLSVLDDHNSNDVPTDIGEATAPNLTENDTDLATTVPIISKPPINSETVLETANVSNNCKSQLEENELINKEPIATEKTRKGSPQDATESKIDTVCDPEIKDGSLLARKDGLAALSKWLIFKQNSLLHNIMEMSSKKRPLPSKDLEHEMIASKNFCLSTDSTLADQLPALSKITAVEDPKDGGECVLDGTFPGDTVASNPVPLTGSNPSAKTGTSANGEEIGDCNEKNAEPAIVDEEEIPEHLKTIVKHLLQLSKPNKSMIPTIIRNSFQLLGRKDVRLPNNESISRYVNSIAT